MRGQSMEDIHSRIVTNFLKTILKSRCSGAGGGSFSDTLELTVFNLIKLLKDIIMSISTFKIILYVGVR